MPKKNKEPTPRYLVLYKERMLHKDPGWFIFHNVKAAENCYAMLEHEIYGAIRIVDLDTIQVIKELDKNEVERQGSNWKPHPWEFDYWKKQKVED